MHFLFQDWPHAIYNILATSFITVLLSIEIAHHFNAHLSLSGHICSTFKRMKAGCAVSSSTRWRRNQEALNAHYHCKILQTVS